MNPIKRSKPLVELSREHHHGLLLCWKIRQGIQKSIEPERICRYVTFFYHNELVPHFEEEEKQLFALLADGHQLKERALAQHREIREMANVLATNPDNEILEKFAKALDDHIRFEERTLFNYMQETIPADKLESVVTTHETSCRVKEEEWQDTFWEKSM